MKCIFKTVEYLHQQAEKAVENLYFTLYTLHSTLSRRVLVYCQASSTTTGHLYFLGWWAFNLYIQYFALYTVIYVVITDNPFTQQLVI